MGIIENNKNENIKMAETLGITWTIGKISNCGIISTTGAEP